jgi:hypothetical protein
MILEKIRTYLTNTDYWREKVNLLERESFSLKDQVQTLKDNLVFERTRAKESEQIYLKRLGIIPPVQSSNAQQNFRPVMRGQTAHDLRQRLTREHESPELKAQRAHWSKKLEEQEKAENNDTSHTQ